MTLPLPLTAYVIPLQPTNQLLSVTLNGVLYNLRVIWNAIAQIWVMDIYDSSSNPVLLGVPLVSGGDLLWQFEYLGIGGQMYAQTSNDTDAPPTFTNLGVTSQLYYVIWST
jgi:hypothetical protein